MPFWSRNCSNQAAKATNQESHSNSPVVTDFSGTKVGERRNRVMENVETRWLSGLYIDCEGVAANHSPSVALASCTSVYLLLFSSHPHSHNGTEFTQASGKVVVAISAVHNVFDNNWIMNLSASDVVALKPAILKGSKQLRATLHFICLNNVNNLVKDNPELMPTV